MSRILHMVGACLQHPPESRRPLRERCQVALAITPISYRDWNRVYDCNCELVLVFEEDDYQRHWDDRDTPTSSPSPTHSLALAEESHLLEVVHGLYIALVDDEADIPALRTFDDRPFTHVVQVDYTIPTPRANDPLVLSNWGREEAPRSALVQRLGQVHPAASLRLCLEQTAVGPCELRAARDFLSLALPHGNTKWSSSALYSGEDGEWGHWNERYAQVGGDVDADTDANADGQFVVLAPDYGLDEWPQDEPLVHVDDDDDVNALIVAPASRAVDVLSVLFCYLAFLADMTPKDLVEAVYFDRNWVDVTLGPWSRGYMELVLGFIGK